MSWVEPIFDRTIEDVRYANEHRDSVQSLKGARNYTDLQRITGNIHYLSALLTEQGYIAQASCKTDWALGEIPARSEILKLQADLNMLKANVSTFGAPATPGLPYTHYEKMNDIEKILLAVEDMVRRIIASYFYSGELYAGEV